MISSETTMKYKLMQSFTATAEEEQLRISGQTENKPKEKPVKRLVTVKAHAGS